MCLDSVKSSHAVCFDVNQYRKPGSADVTFPMAKSELSDQSKKARVDLSDHIF